MIAPRPTPSSQSACGTPCTGRTGETEQSTADLEDAAFRYYLPMARSLAHSMCGESNDRVTAEQAAELGLAHAVLAWRQRSSAGFRRFARSAIMRQISSR